MSIIKRLFRKSGSTTNMDRNVDVETLAREYLSQLPRCTKNVVLVTPKYGDVRYTCQVFMKSATLLPWALKHAKGVISMKQGEQVARLALPLWLGAADETTKSATALTDSMFQVVKPYIPEFVKKGSVNVFCYQCDSFVSGVRANELNREENGPWVSWTDVWNCPHGHQLYREDHEIHFQLRQ